MPRKFLVDRMLGKLARELRLLGYDALYYGGERLPDLIDLGRKEHRVILTRNPRLIPKRPEDQIVHLTEDRPALQLRQLVDQGDVPLDESLFFSRCLLCNALLEGIPRQTVEGKVPDFIFYQHEEFFHCPQCQKIYWPGTHQEDMKQKILNMLRSQVEVRVK